MSYHRDRDPLTLRVPRTLREASRDPYAWIERATPKRARPHWLSWTFAIALLLYMAAVYFKHGTGPLQ